MIIDEINNYLQNYLWLRYRKSILNLVTDFQLAHKLKRNLKYAKYLEFSKWHIHTIYLHNTL